MVSLELVGEVFEVSTQVDRDLTTVSRVYRRLGLIKNPGRHSYTALHLSGAEDVGSPRSPHSLRRPARLDNKALEIATTSACFDASTVMVTKAKKPRSTSPSRNRSIPRPHWMPHQRRRSLPRPCRPGQDGGHRRQPRGEI
jgi:hypothetical protein